MLVEEIGISLDQDPAEIHLISHYKPVEYRYRFTKTHIQFFYFNFFLILWLQSNHNLNHVNLIKIICCVPQKRRFYLSPCGELKQTLFDSYADAGRSDTKKLNSIIENCNVQWTESTQLLKKLVLEPAR